MNDSFGLLTNKQQNNILEKDFISSIVCSSVTDNPAHVHCSAKGTMNAIRGMLCERSAVRPWNSTRMQKPDSDLTVWILICVSAVLKWFYLGVHSDQIRYRYQHLSVLKYVWHQGDQQNYYPVFSRWGLSGCSLTMNEQTVWHTYFQIEDSPCAVSVCVWLTWCLTFKSWHLQLQHVVPAAYLNFGFKLQCFELNTAAVMYLPEDLRAVHCEDYHSLFVT